MRFKIVFLLFLMLITIRENTIGQSSIRKHINLDEDWKFHLGHAANPEKDFNYGITTLFSKSGNSSKTAIDSKFNDSSWRNLDLPHDWAVELPFVNSPDFDVMSHGYKPVGGRFPETSIGWYRKYFSVARADSGSRFQIQFDGIFRDAKIWLNGFYLGNNESGYMGISYDVTDYVKFDQTNVLVVRVDATQYEGWFYEGAGIYRHVWLNQYNNLHFRDGGQYVYAEIKGSTATVNIETTIENLHPAPARFSVYSYITDRQGNKITASREEEVSLAVNGVHKSQHPVSIPSPKLWSLEDPYLYHVVSVIKRDGKEVDVIKTRFGVRSFRFEGASGFFLNDKPVKLKGTNNHQDHAGVGSAMPDYLHYYRLKLLKELGVNAYRASHNPPTPELLDACDSLGILVIDENRLLNSSPEYMDQLERLILRDRNHPSIFLWCIGNEEGWIQTNSHGKRIAQTLLAKQKELDPSRTSTYAADLPNVYSGINEVIPVRGFNYRQFAVADYHRDHPDQPLVGTEMGSTVTTRGIYVLDSIKGYVPDQDITAPWWASKAEDWWTLAADNAYWMGGFVWTGFDYRGEPTPYQWPNISSHFGIMDMCGFPKNIYYYYQSWWTNKDVLHISPHWNWKGTEGKNIDVWVNTNAEKVELFLNGKSLGMKVMPRNRHLNWQVKYSPGELKAVGYKEGRKITSAVFTTGEPYEIKIVSDKMVLKADGKDVTVVNISVVDKNGREVPDANNMIRFKLNGVAKIIGVGNGDPSCHEPDKYLDQSEWKRSLFNGKCQVILQSGKQVNDVILEAYAEGIKLSRILIKTE